MAEFATEFERRRFAVGLVKTRVTVVAAAGMVGRTEQWLHKWLRRFEAEGEAGLAERSRAPRRRPQATPEAVRVKILATRVSLEATEFGGVGVEAIRYELECEGFAPPPSLSTIERTGFNDLEKCGLVVGRHNRAAGPVVGVLQPQESGIRPMHVGAVDLCLQGLGKRVAPPAFDRCRCYACDACVAAGLASDDVRICIDEKLVTRAAMHHERGEVRHGAAQDEESRLSGQHLCDPVLQPSHGRVFAIGVVSELGAAHRLQHCLRGKSLGVTAEIDGLAHRRVLSEAQAVLLGVSIGFIDYEKVGRALCPACLAHRDKGDGGDLDQRTEEQPLDLERGAGRAVLSESLDAHPIKVGVVVELREINGDADHVAQIPTGTSKEALDSIEAPMCLGGDIISDDSASLVEGKLASHVHPPSRPLNRDEVAVAGVVGSDSLDRHSLSLVPQRRLPAHRQGRRRSRLGRPLSPRQDPGPVP